MGELCQACEDMIDYWTQWSEAFGETPPESFVNYDGEEEAGAPRHIREYMGWT